ncbi:SDR family oxidoreductase [Brevibacterium aurantiacum]|uniref:SDR family oxidoreductase n=1 Tax=Brevibacterium aurantiacum TaxID=273384 RepID=A0A556CAS2_BREAU|nr:SDR family oxidoreductase [Brevibacterium aurantiacum]TSI14544.1 SDR family oxidoreductase [Brevibacterium aurantiacum]
MTRPHSTIVTGSGSGIGRAIVHALAHDPDDPPQVIAALDSGYSEKVRQTRTGASVILEFSADVTDEERIAEIFDDLATNHPPVLKVAHAAGVLQQGALADTGLDEYSRVMGVNATGTFIVLRQTARTLRLQHEQGEHPGAIVTVSSNAAAVPRIGMAAYAASKAAVSALSANAALELASLGARCNTVAPGSTDSPMQRSMWHDDDDRDRARVIAGDPEAFRLGIPLGRIADPRDIAEVVQFALSDKARHMTMQEIVVDGGASLRS